MRFQRERESFKVTERGGRERNTEREDRDWKRRMGLDESESPNINRVLFSFARERRSERASERETERDRIGFG